MGLIDFFRGKAKPSDAVAPQGVDPEIKKCMAEISERLRRIESKQKETSLQLEEIDSLLHDDGEDEHALVGALIELADTIEDFYRFAADSEHSPLFEQARMMWNVAKSATEGTDLKRIENASEPFDFQRCSVESTAYDESMPIGHVIRTLKCGYIYKDKVVRRAAVVVNRAKTPGQEP